MSLVSANRNSALFSKFLLSDTLPGTYIGSFHVDGSFSSPPKANEDKGRSTPATFLVFNRVPSKSGAAQKPPGPQSKGQAQDCGELLEFQSRCAMVSATFMTAVFRQTPPEATRVHGTEEIRFRKRPCQNQK